MSQTFKNNTEPNIEPNNTEKLIIRYRNLIQELKAIRGKLYSRGIDPEKYTHI